MGEQAKLQDILMDDIIEPAEQVRTVIVLEDLQQLSASIKEKGIIQPLIVLKKGDKYEVTDGHRRYLASKMAGLSSVPCIIRALDVKEADFVKLLANSFREDVNPVDEGKYFVRIHEKYNLAYREIAQLCSRSETYVVNRIQLLQGDGRVLSALEAKQLNFSQALEIMRAQDDSIRFELLRVTVESGATTESIRLIRHDYEQRLRNQDPASASGIPPAGNYPEVKHLIGCPICSGSYPVTEIYPISVCKTCYDGFLEGLKGGKSG